MPEWCEQGGPKHDKVCDNAPMEPMTKREFVEFLRVAAEQGIDGYLTMLADSTPDEAKAIAVEAVDESATCYAGIGSCGRGWCHHG